MFKIRSMHPPLLQPSLPEIYSVMFVLPLAVYSEQNLLRDRSFSEPLCPHWPVQDSQMSFPHLISLLLLIPPPLPNQRGAEKIMKPRDLWKDSICQQCVWSESSLRLRRDMSKLSPWVVCAISLLRPIVTVLLSIVKWPLAIIVNVTGACFSFCFHKSYKVL